MVTLADPDTLHRAYIALLNHPDVRLTTTHRLALAARGFTEGLAEDLKYRSHPGPGSWKIARSLLDKLGESIAGI